MIDDCIGHGNQLIDGRRRRSNRNNVVMIAVMSDSKTCLSLQSEVAASRAEQSRKDDIRKDLGDRLGHFFLLLSLHKTSPFLNECGRAETRSRRSRSRELIQGQGRRSPLPVV